MKLLDELWLHCVCDFEADIAAKLAGVFGEDDEGFCSDEIDIAILKKLGIPTELADKLRDPEIYRQAQEIIEYCKRDGIRIIALESEEYPEALRHVELPPRILFTKGLPLEESCGALSVAVVGCRKPTEHGKTAARAIGKSLAQSGISVIAGLAEGIDTEGHWGAIEGGGKTVAVLAGSVDNIYPASNRKLYYEILKHGTVVSERPPGTAVRPYFYTQRNRIIVGLSRGTVIVEGAMKGGTAITANWAEKYNRDVFGVPGTPVCWQSELPNALISDGAVVVKSFDEPARYYGEQLPAEVKAPEDNETSDRPSPAGLGAEERKIYSYVYDCGGVATNEELLEASGLTQKRLNVHLTMLCIKGIIRQESGNRYILVK